MVNSEHSYVQEQEYEDEDESAPEEEEFRALFEDDEGQPITFFFHESIKRPNYLTNLKKDIKEHGGRILRTAEGADTILFDHRRVEHKPLQEAYNLHPIEELRGGRVERMSFVQRCIRLNAFIHTPGPREQGMGGKAPGTKRRPRTPFSHEDEAHICEYLAARIPYKENGGRTGRNIWKELIEMGEAMPDHYGWVFRHSWQSWRERYKKNWERFDRDINVMVKRNPPKPHQMYHLRRKQNNNAGDTSGEEFSGFENPEDEGETDEEFDYATGAHGKRRRLAHPLEPLSKKQRYSKTSGKQHQRLRYRDDSVDDIDSNIRPRPRGKRKAKALPPSSDTEHDSLFDEVEDHSNEQGRSKSQHTPAISQITLVGTQPGSSTQATHMSTKEPLKRRAARRPKEAIEGSDDEELQSALINRAESPHPEFALPVQEGVTIQTEEATPERAVFSPTLARFSSPILRASSPQAYMQIPETVPETEAPQTRTAKSKPKAKSKARTETQIKVHDAPYLATRSRSRSRTLEPTVKQRSSRQERKKDVEEEPILLEPVNEADEDPANSFVAEDVPVKDKPHLDTDDTQIDRIVRPRQSLFSQADQPDVILQRYGTLTSAKGLQSKPSTSQSPMPIDVFNDPGIPAQRLIGFSWRSGTASQNASAGRSQGLREASASSGESFPVPGTRASIKRKKLEEQERHTPYKPPKGTRAYKLTQSK